jgi:hypothetical protein
LHKKKNPPTPHLPVGCPPNVTVSTDMHVCEAVVWYGSVQSTDNCGVSSTLLATTQWANGTSFPLGLSNVSYWSNDTSSNTASCTFGVRVVDQEAPRLSECVWGGCVCVCVCVCAGGWGGGCVGGCVDVWTCVYVVVVLVGRSFVRMSGLWQASSLTWLQHALAT